MISDKQAKTYGGERTASSTNGAGKTGYVHAENETRFLSFTLYQYQFKDDQNTLI
jgi:hypothetical protein